MFNHLLLTSLNSQDAQAMHWYQRAAEQNDAEAQFHLGQMYEYGEVAGTTSEEAAAQAVHWYQRAAEQNSVSAPFCLGKMYEKGRVAGTTSEEADAQAVHWYQRAAERGYLPVSSNLVRLHDRIDEKSELALSIEYFFFNSYCCGNAAIKQNKTEALKWFNKYTMHALTYLNQLISFLLSSTDTNEEEINRRIEFVNARSPENKASHAMFCFFGVHGGFLQLNYTKQRVQAYLLLLEAEKEKALQAFQAIPDAYLEKDDFFHIAQLYLSLASELEEGTPEKQQHFQQAYHLLTLGAEKGCELAKRLKENAFTQKGDNIICKTTNEQIIIEKEQAMMAAEDKRVSLFPGGRL